MTEKKLSRGVTDVFKDFSTADIRSLHGKVVTLIVSEPAEGYLMLHAVDDAAKTAYVLSIEKIEEEKDAQT